MKVYMFLITILILNFGCSKKEIQTQSTYSKVVFSNVSSTFDKVFPFCKDAIYVQLISLKQNNLPILVVRPNTNMSIDTLVIEFGACVRTFEEMKEKRFDIITDSNIYGYYDKCIKSEFENGVVRQNLSQIIFAGDTVDCSSDVVFTKLLSKDTIKYRYKEYLGGDVTQKKKQYFNLFKIDLDTIKMVATNLDTLSNVLFKSKY